MGVHRAPPLATAFRAAAPGTAHVFLFLPLLVVAAAVGSVSAQAPYACAHSNPATRYYGFCKTALSIQQRANDLVSRLTLQEKIAQLGNTAAGVPRLGIPPYQWWSESLHGVSNSGPGIRFTGPLRSATSFPQVILTGASFNPLLWYRIGQAIGTEARAVYNAGEAKGLTFWSPNINIFRDPRWGRGQETPGEDPTTTSKYAVSYVRGLQGDSYEGGRLGVGLKASACCKHFTAYDLDKWKDASRYSFDARVSAQDLEDTFQPPFRSCVMEGRASGIMCSYNRVNGIPTCADYNLLSKTARGSWGFYGYITSDCDAVQVMRDNHGYAKTPMDAVADSLKAGMDVNCGTYLQNYTAKAVQEGYVSEGDIDRALRNLFSIRMRLGLFNGNPRLLPYGDIGPSQVCTQEHQNLALEAARDGIVLLKNSAGVLPLSRSKVTSLGVIGPNANNGWVLLGNYAGPPCKSVTPLLALKSYVGDTRWLAGCDSVACPSASINEAAQLAGSVDYVVMFMGLDQTQEKEDQDRIDLVLPGMQQSLITSVARAAKRPIILVLLCGGPVDVTFAKYDQAVGAILWAGYPGEGGGTALAEVLFGEHNPGGRLPITWYPQEFTRVPMTDMRMRPDAASGYPGRTYRFYTGRPVFHFGDGLSYSAYSYQFVSVTENPLYLNKSISLQDLKVPGSNSLDITKMASESCEKLKSSAVVGVKNHGKMAGRHPVLLFLRRSNPPLGSPMKQLIGFESVHLHAGESTKIRFTLSPCEHLTRTEVDGSKLLDEGSYFLMVGSKEHHVRLFA